MANTSLADRFRNGWNAFFNKDPIPDLRPYGTMISSTRPDRKRLLPGNERTIIASLYNRIAIDVAQIQILHVKLDENNRYLDTVDDDLNKCFTLEANLDQTGRALIQDIVLSMFDEGCVAVVPTDTSGNPYTTGSYSIYELRTGKILEWYPDAVKVRVYNERKGRKEDIVCRKDTVAIIENPLYNVMNEPNSTLKRLIRKLNNLDAIDEQSSSGKLNMIISLPYVIKTDARRQQAEHRRKDIEDQLYNSKYGIAYTDGTEHVTQLNRPLENNLMDQITYLTNTLYGQLGINEEVFSGKADEQTLLNYYNTTVVPVISAITDEFKRKFLTKTARSQGQSIAFFRDPFKLVPVNNIADIADKFTRNAVLSSNEVRGIIGFKPVDDPDADALRNKNLNQSDEELKKNAPPEVGREPKGIPPKN